MPKLSRARGRRSLPPPAAPWPGRPYPLGASWNGEGTNFALFSAHAEAVELCLFDAGGLERRFALAERSGHIWHGFLPGVGPGQRYGYRVTGPFVPERGHLFNPAKLLIDPYAYALDGDVDQSAGRTLTFAPGDELLRDPDDSAAAMPKCLVVDPAFDWGGDRRPATAWPETVIYELHVRGFSLLNTEVPKRLRGTYAGLGAPASVAYLRSLGVTAVELLPVHQSADEPFLGPLGLTNFWGYSSIGFLAPHAAYAADRRPGGQVREFKTMVKALHRAGIEVILDVVYNHTAEGATHGPTLSFRGIDNASYYRSDPDRPGTYVDVTGTGNTLDPDQPQVLRLIMDSLRYWAAECHVDGFRFDLAPALAREHGEVDAGAAFFDVVQQDPVLSGVKLIAEPWDAGPGGYQVGNFPSRWREWNGPYRDAMRDFWRGRAGLGEFARRLAGSSDLYAAPGRPPSASINFVTCHDGFTLADLVAFERKHNEANGQDNLDGSDDNRSWNMGVEGESDDAELRARRARQQRNFLATLLLSQGVPMLLAGDERGRSQRGNNNAWCQDNEISWLDWALDEERRALLAFTRRLIALRLAEPVFRRRTFLSDDGPGERHPGAWWFRPDGRKLSVDDWLGERHALGVFLNGSAIGDRTTRGEPVTGDSFVLLVNAEQAALSFKLPPARFGETWRVELSTVDPAAPATAHSAGGVIELDALSIVLLRRAV